MSAASPVAAPKCTCDPLRASSAHFGSCPLVSPNGSFVSANTGELSTRAIRFHSNAALSMEEVARQAAQIEDLKAKIEALERKS